MTDAFDKEIQEIAMRAAGNGGPTIADVLKAVVALNEDLSSQIDEYAKISSEQLERHCSDIPHMTKDQFAGFIKDRNELLESSNRTFFMWVLGSKFSFVGFALLITFVTMFATEWLASLFGMK